MSNERQPNFLRGALVGAGAGLATFAIQGAMLANNPKSQIDFNLVELSFYIVAGAIVGTFTLSKSNPSNVAPPDQVSINPELTISEEAQISSHKERKSSSWSLKSWRTAAIVMHFASAALLGIFYVMLQSTPLRLNLQVQRPHIGPLPCPEPITT